MTATVTPIHGAGRCTATKGAHRGVVRLFPGGPFCEAHQPQYSGPFGVVIGSHGAGGAA